MVYLVRFSHEIELNILYRYKKIIDMFTVIKLKNVSVHITYIRVGDIIASTNNYK